MSHESEEIINLVYLIIIKDTSVGGKIPLLVKVANYLNLIYLPTDSITKTCKVASLNAISDF
jgi:hypothetical protein